MAHLIRLPVDSRGMVNLCPNEADPRDNVEEFVIDDIKDMKDDEFDYADLSNGDVDVDEMFDLDADKNEADVDEVPEEVEISNKYDWSW